MKFTIKRASDPGYGVPPLASAYLDELVLDFEQHHPVNDGFFRETESFDGVYRDGELRWLAGNCAHRIVFSERWVLDLDPALIMALSYEIGTPLVVGWNDNGPYPFLTIYDGYLE